MSGSRRKLTRQVLAFAMAGIFIAIGVSWSLAWTEEAAIRESDEHGARVMAVVVDPDTRREHATETWAAERWRIRGGVAYMSHRARGGRWDPEAVHTGRSPREFIPSWSGLHEPPERFGLAADSAERDHRGVVAWGWPRAALLARLEYRPGVPASVSSAIDLTPRGAGVPPRILPLEPVWGGLAVNSALFGSGMFLLWNVPAIVRRRVRSRRGRCVACGYDLRGSGGGVCPECGAGK